MTDDGWPGVIAWIGDGVRLVVSSDATHYRVQNLTEGPDGPMWLGRPGRAAATLTKEIKVHLAACPALADVAAVLPEQAGEAFPAFALAVADLEARLRATNCRSASYCRVVAQDTQIRVIVDQAGSVYGLQWIAERDWLADVDGWKTLASCEARLPLQAKLADVAFMGGYGKRGGAGWDRMRKSVALRAEALFEHLPDYAAQGSWPRMPQVFRLGPDYELPARLAVEFEWGENAC